MLDLIISQILFKPASFNLIEKYGEKLLNLLIFFITICEGLW